MRIVILGVVIYNRVFISVFRGCICFRFMISRSRFVSRGRFVCRCWGRFVGWSRGRFVSWSRGRFVSRSWGRFVSRGRSRFVDRSRFISGCRCRVGWSWSRMVSKCHSGKDGEGKEL